MGYDSSAHVHRRNSNGSFFLIFLFICYVTFSHLIFFVELSYAVYFYYYYQASERGALGVIGQIMITLGFLYVYVLGSLVSYVWLNILCSVIPLVFFIWFCFMPETPFYQLSKNNVKEAERSLVKLRKKTVEGVKEELNLLQVRK